MYIELRTTALPVEESLLQNIFGAVLNSKKLKSCCMAWEVWQQQRCTN